MASIESSREPLSRLFSGTFNALTHEGSINGYFFFLWELNLVASGNRFYHGLMMVRYVDIFMGTTIVEGQ
jgi:hypothetical protein